jgi:hypothetical protein
MKHKVKMPSKRPRVHGDEIEAKQSVRIPSKLPKVLRDAIDDDVLSLAIDMNDMHAVIEIAGCVDPKTMKVDPAVQRLIERAGSYTEYVPRSDGIRIIGRSFGEAIDLDCDGDSSDSDFTISIYRNCDRWVDISGIPIVEKRFSNIDKLIDELMEETQLHLYLH